MFRLSMISIELRNMLIQTSENITEKGRFMPIHQNEDGTWQWGKSGKKYKSREEAVKQMKAIFANGYREHMTKSAAFNFIAGIAAQASMIKTAADYLTATVKPGETAYSLRKSVPGKDWNQQLAWLKSNNPNIKNINKLRPGDKLNVGFKPNTYTIQPGDTLWGLRKKFTGGDWNAQQAEAQRLNPNINFQRLTPGTVINLSAIQSPAVSKAPAAKPISKPVVKAHIAKPTTPTPANTRRAYTPHIYDTQPLKDKQAEAARIAQNRRYTMLNTLAFTESNNNLYAQSAADSKGRRARGPHQFRNPATKQVVRMGAVPRGTTNSNFLGNQDLSDTAAEAYINYVAKAMKTKDPVVTYAGYFQGPYAFNKVKNKYLAKYGNNLEKAQRAWAQSFPAVRKFRDKYNQQLAKWK